MFVTKVFASIVSEVNSPSVFELTESVVISAVKVVSISVVAIVVLLIVVLGIVPEVDWPVVEDPVDDMDSVVVENSVKLVD